MVSRFLEDARLACPDWMVALLLRQEEAWRSGDFSVAAADWAPTGELTAPGNRIPVARLAETVRAFAADYGDLDVRLTNAFASADQSRLALEWSWTVTRRADGARSTTPDAIVVDFDGRLIRSWREYFDTAGAVEAHHAGAAG